MVSLRCKLLVKDELAKLGVIITEIDLGFVELAEALTIKQLEQFRINLLKAGLEVMEDKKGILVEKIKNILIEEIHYSKEPRKQNYSEFLAETLGYEYNYLSNIFTEVKGMT